MTAETTRPGHKQAQRLLRLYHFYRLSVGITLVLLISSNMDSELLSLANGELLRSGSWLYLILNILLVVFLENTRRPTQLFTLALVDVLLLCGLFYAGGGVASAIGNLLIVSVAISNTLLRRHRCTRHRRFGLSPELQPHHQSQRIPAARHSGGAVFCCGVAGTRPDPSPGSQ